MELAGKTAVATVGAKGIGKAISECLAKSCAPVWVWDMSPVENVGYVVVALSWLARISRYCKVDHRVHI